MKPFPSKQSTFLLPDKSCHASTCIVNQRNCRCPHNPSGSSCAEIQTAAASPLKWNIPTAFKFSPAASARRKRKHEISAKVNSCALKRRLSRKAYCASISSQRQIERPPGFLQLLSYLTFCPYIAKKTSVRPELQCKIFRHASVSTASNLIQGITISSRIGVSVSH